MEPGAERPENASRSHMGWLMDSDGTKIRRNKQNASDLSPGAYGES